MLIVKLHPFEEALVRDRIHSSGNIALLTNDMLTSSGIDLYEVLGSCDALITDYSSVYFDLLLLNKPVLFAPVDVEEYRQKRGFLLDPYEFWTPGPKVFDQRSMQMELDKLLSDPEYYSQERKQICEMVHTYPDDQSSERTWLAVDEYLDQLDKKSSVKAQAMSEMDQLKQNVKSFISKCIEAGRVEDAKKALEKYEGASALDAELMSMKAIIKFIEGYSAEAIEILMLGYYMDRSNFDIIYNLAHIYETLDDRTCALHYYEKAKALCTDQELLGALNESISNLSNKRI